MKGGEEQRGGRPLPADEVLILLTDVLLRYLEQLKDARAAGENSFLYGEQTAYTECTPNVWNGSGYGNTLPSTASILTSRSVIRCDVSECGRLFATGAIACCVVFSMMTISASVFYIPL